MSKYIEKVVLLNVPEPQLLNIGSCRIVEIKLAGGGTGEINLWIERNMLSPSHDPRWFQVVHTGATYPVEYEHLKMLVTRSGTETHVLREQTAI